MLDYLYYRFYLVGTLIGNQDAPKSKGMFLFYVFQVFNLFSIAMLIADLGVSMNANLTPIHGIIIGSVLILLNYQFFYRRHKKIINRFISETKKQQETGFVLLALYILFTIIAFYLVLPSNR